MGIDKSLSDAYPSIVINGSKYHYGKTPEYGSYLVENASYAKDYWSFKEEVDLRAFLTDLPESADRNLRRRLHPDWLEVTPEQRDAYFEQDKLLVPGVGRREGQEWHGPFLRHGSGRKKRPARAAAYPERGFQREAGNDPRTVRHGESRPVR